MLLTLILNLGMAAGVVVPIIPPPGGGGGSTRGFGRIRWDDEKDYKKHKKEDQELIKILDVILENL